METLAYLKLVASCKLPTAAKINQIAPSKLYRNACINFLSLVVAIGILGMAREAMAALKVGSRGPQVTAIQQSLRLLGYNNVSASGYYDQQTASAVSQFQRSQRLKADGIVGSRTQSALFQRVAAQVQFVPQNQYFGLPGNRTVLPSPPVNRNSDIVLLQERLRNSGFYYGQINGVLNSETQQALQRFQQYYGLNVNNTIVQQIPQNINVNNNLNSLLPGNVSNNTFAIQQRLRELGLYNGQIDGIFGTETDLALRRFQAQVGLFPDGIPGSETLRVLFATTGTPSQRSGTPSPQPNKNRYVVIVPGSFETLIKVSQYVKEAYLTESKEGSYVNSGEFANPDVAKSRSYLLRSRGLDARVIYR